ncbi:MAG: hypothetical protein KC416_07675, partial [Myxococcales bacterium]|nr:hypothetical protein [Myxococcales bacterium]
SGIFIDNRNPNQCRMCEKGLPCSSWCDDWCTKEFDHKWANKVTKAALEIYPHDDDYGGVRLVVSDFSHASNGGVYSEAVGTITLPKAGASGVAKLNGFVWKTRGGAAVGNDEFNIDFFHFGPAKKTSAGVDTLGFGSTHTNGDGYYLFRAVYYGNHKTYLTDKKSGKKKVVWVNLASPDVRLDFYLDEPCFGYAGGCEDP